MADFNQRTPRKNGEWPWAAARAHILNGGKARRDVWWDSWLVKAGSLFKWHWHNPMPQLVREAGDAFYTPCPMDTNATDWVLE